MPWYAITVHPGQELRVRAELERRAALAAGAVREVVVPLEEVAESRNGHPVRVESRTLPGYVLLDATLTDGVWALLRGTPGVAGLVGAANEPTPLAQLEVDRLLRREVLPSRPRAPFAVGDAVEVTEGPFVGLSGTVSQVNRDAARLKVLLSMFDQETPAEVRFDQVKAR